MYSMSKKINYYYYQWASEKGPGWSSMTQYHVIFPW